MMKSMIDEVTKLLGCNWDQVKTFSLKGSNPDHEVVVFKGINEDYCILSQGKFGSHIVKASSSFEESLIPF